MRQIAQGRDADGLTDAFDAHPQLGGDIEPRFDDDFRTRQIAVNLRIADLIEQFHFREELATGLFDQWRVITDEKKFDIPATAGTLTGEIQAAVRHLIEDGHHALLPLLLAQLAIGTRDEAGIDIRVAYFARVAVADELDHVGHFGRLAEHGRRRGRHLRRVFERAARGHLDVEL